MYYKCYDFCIFLVFSVIQVRQMKAVIQVRVEQKLKDRLVRWFGKNLSDRVRISLEEIRDPSVKHVGAGLKRQGAEMAATPKGGSFPRRKADLGGLNPTPMKTKGDAERWVSGVAVPKPGGTFKKRIKKR